MKTIYQLLLVGLIAASCNNSNEEQPLKDPSITQPPSESIPDSTKIVNDSVIVPDVVPGNGKHVGNSDSIQKSKQ